MTMITNRAPNASAVLLRPSRRSASRNGCVPAGGRPLPSALCGGKGLVWTQQTDIVLHCRRETENPRLAGELPGRPIIENARLEHRGLEVNSIQQEFHERIRAPGDLVCLLRLVGVERRPLLCDRLNMVAGTTSSFASVAWMCGSSTLPKLLLFTAWMLCASRRMRVRRLWEVKELPGIAGARPGFCIADGRPVDRGIQELERDLEATF